MYVAGRSGSTREPDLARVDEARRYRHFYLLESAGGRHIHGTEVSPIRLEAHAAAERGPYDQ